MRISIVTRGMLLGLVACMLACGTCKRPPASQTAQTPARPERPTLRLVMMTDLDGYLQPCGCQSRPLGGIDRAATRLRELRSDGIPTVFLTAGNLLFAPESEDPKLDGSDAELKLQRTWQAEALAKILGGLELAAAVPGPADRHEDQLESLAKSAGLPLLAARAGASEELLIERGAVKLGVAALDETLTPDDPQRHVAQSTQALRARGAEIVVALVRGDARAARRIAGSVKGLDFVLHGGADVPEVPPPEPIGSATLLRAAHRGHGLLVVELTRVGSGSFSDVSPWTREVHKHDVERRIEELSARVAEWKRDPQVNAGELAQQEARLAALRNEAAAAPPPVAGNVFSARFIELDKDTPADPATRALLDAHDKRVNEHTRIALANVLPKPVAKGEPSYAGSERCGACHEAAYAWWQEHPHGKAYATLEQRNAQFNLSCVGCHVTGYNQPGGSTVAHTDGLINVGCESCHGPGSLHAKNPDVDDAKNVRRDAAESVCKRCHNPEHSDRFEYMTYVKKLIVKGHGLPAERAN